jgi:hypothetical protein
MLCAHRVKDIVNMPRSQWRVELVDAARHAVDVAALILHGPVSGGQNAKEVVVVAATPTYGCRRGPATPSAKVQTMATTDGRRRHQVLFTTVLLTVK